MKYLNNAFPGSSIFETVNGFKLYLKDMIYGYEIWRYLLFVLISFIIIEMILSNYYLYDRK